jgi:hypothetical protein
VAASGDEKPEMSHSRRQRSARDAGAVGGGVTGGTERPAGVGRSRGEDATRWYSSFADNSIFDLAYLAPSHFRRGVIAERAGAREAAAEHYGRVIALWSRSDSALRPLVDSAQQGLARLAARP